MNNISMEIRMSADGSTTLYRPDLDEHYHSTFGAVQESMHVFIEAGLKQCCGQPLHILEVGFGTGLNVLLTLLHTSHRKVIYHTVEKYPVAHAILKSLNYPQLLGDESKTVFDTIHSVSWNKEHEIRPNFRLKKIDADLADSLFQTNFYNLVFFDAFAPDKQPELWTPVIFRKIYRAMQQGGILTTYCAKGAVRRAMQSCGFTVERIPGPKGKREMVRAFIL
jgi:tRNA U34 5-methylaminomethyl-2-thiouridine-forming methyltransferase MnmC